MAQQPALDLERYRPLLRVRRRAMKGRSAGVVVSLFCSAPLLAQERDRSLERISLALQQQGYKVVTAANGEDAVTVAAQTQPNLILMDINLPELDGLGATRRILENETLRDVPIVVVTAFGTEGFQRAAYDVGASGYLTKPIDLDRMNILIARLLSTEGSGPLFKQS